MRRIAAIFLTVALGLQVAAAPAQQQAPDGINHEIEVKKGESQIVKAASGTGGTGFLYDSSCSSSQSSVYNTCEKTLAHFLSTGKAVAELAPSYPSDFDVYVYASDKSGKIGAEVASSGAMWTPTAPGEKAEWPVKKGEYYVIVVAYFVGGGGYQMTVGVN